MIKCFIRVVTALLEHFDFKVWPIALEYNFDFNQFLKLLGKNQLFSYSFYVFPPYTYV